MEEEHATFLRYAETTKINSTLFDHTGNGDTHYAVRLNGSESERIGLAKSLAVMTGDMVRAEVFAKYLDPDPSNWTAAMQDVVSGEGNVTLNIVQDNGNAYRNSVPMSKDGLLRDYGGGYTVHSGYVILSNQLPATTGSNKSNTWTLGAVAMHELLYHIHSAGRSEGGDPNRMRNHYKMKTGKKHGAGSRQKY